VSWWDYFWFKEDFAGGGEGRGGVYLEVLLGCQNFTEGFACFDTQGIAKEPDFLDVVVAEVLDMGFDVGGRVELETPALKGEYLIRACHRMDIGY
jgi:hypothetical protein